MKKLFLFFLLIFLPNQVWSAPKSIKYEKEIKFKDTYHGAVAKVKTMLYNTSATDSFIDRIKTSCGCTSAKLKDKTVPANGLLEVSFEIDTLQKVGDIRKTARVYFKNDNRPLTIYITGKILPQPKGHEMHNSSKSIFSEECASCHVSPGNKLKGQSLYLSDCAMCHGTLKQGASAPPLTANLFNPTWIDTIIKGKGNIMLGFHQDHGGTRSQQQIDSLIEYLDPKEDNSQAYRSKAPALIYYRWCAACHGNEKMGPIGPDIRSHNLKHFTPESLSQFLKAGSSPTMPSFHQDNKGPFNDDDLLNLAKYLIGPR